VTVEKRLKLAYAGEADMRHTTDERTTTATLRLPLRVEADAV
jgi:hypothetical protein